jgi:hypothetical protein
VERLTRHGIDARELPMPGMIHAFLNLEDLVPEVCADTYKAVADFLEAAVDDSR